MSKYLVILLLCVILYFIYILISNGPINGRAKTRPGGQVLPHRSSDIRRLA